MINQIEPLIGDNIISAVNDYMTSGSWLTEHKRTQEFASMISDFTKSEFTYIFPNGTLTLTAALYACGVRANDEVIVPNFTMVATANAAVLLGCKVKFVDISLENLCMDFMEFKSNVTSNTKAVILVSINGRYPDNIQMFVDFCRENNIWLIEDAAQSLGSKYKNKHIGTFGDIGSFSFSMPKIITTGQGGALVTNNKILADRLKYIRDFGREKPGADHYLTQGWNFKFTDLQAVIGIEQMKELEYRINRKKEIYTMYFNALKHIDKITFIQTDLSQTTPWFIDILVDKRDELIEFLNIKAIKTREFYPALNCEPVYNDKQTEYPNSVLISHKGLWLPSSLTLSNEDIEYICNSIINFYNR